MTEEQNSETAVDPIEQAREEGYRKGLYQGRCKAEEALFAKLYAQIAKCDPHFEGLAVVRELIMSSPFSTMDIPEGMTPLAELEFKGNRVYHMLMREGVRCIELLLTMNEADLLDLRQFGPTSLNEVKEVLAKRGLELKPL